MRPFLLIFNSLLVPRQKVLDYLDTRPEVLNWYAFLDSGIFIVSNRTAYDLADLIRKAFPGVFFVVTEVPRGLSDGWLPQIAWEFINNPRPSGRWG